MRDSLGTTSDLPDTSPEPPLAVRPRPRDNLVSTRFIRVDAPRIVACILDAEPSRQLLIRRSVLAGCCEQRRVCAPSRLAFQSRRIDVETRDILRRCRRTFCRMRVPEMVAFETSEGTLEIPDLLVRAVAQRAETHAALTAGYLEAIGLLPSQSSRLPAACLIELVAVLELRLWEQQGLRRHLDVDLPSYGEAADAFVARCAKGPSEFEGPEATTLSQRVLRARIENFAWDGPQHLQADVLISDVDEDEFINLLADFVWDNRRELGHLIRREGQE